MGPPASTPRPVSSPGRTSLPQTRQILRNFAVMLAAVGSDLDHVIHVDVYLLDIADFEAMNGAYVEGLGPHRPARTAIGVAALPKAGAVVTMGLTAVVAG